MTHHAFVCAARLLVYEEIELCRLRRNRCACVDLVCQLCLYYLQYIMYSVFCILYFVMC
eukprot:COSAG02_NODE_63375_length_263_cov_0.719512_1_plen_58_part_01